MAHDGRIKHLEKTLTRTSVNISYEWYQLVDHFPFCIIMIQLNDSDLPNLKTIGKTLAFKQIILIKVFTFH